VVATTNTPIDSVVIENIIKTTHIFNDIKVVSKPCVCKVSSKSNIAIIWINIWDLQNRSLAKKIINQSFNVGSFITSVRRANMNPVFYNIKTTGSGATLYSCAISKGLNALNAMNPTNTNTTVTLIGAAKPTSKLTLLISKLSKENHVHIHSSVLIAKAITKPIYTHAYSSITALTRNGIPRYIRSFVKTGIGQHTQL